MGFIGSWLSTAIATAVAIWIVPGIEAVGGSWAAPIFTALSAADQRTKDLVRELLGATISANVESAKDAVANALAKPVGWGLAGNRLWPGQQAEP